MLTNWRALVADFHEVYSVDLTPEFMRTRSWRWFMVRLDGLLARPPRIEQVETTKGTRIVRFPTTRLGNVLTPPEWPKN